MKTNILKKCNGAVPVHIRVLAGVLGVAILFFGFFGFLISYGRGMYHQTGIFYAQRPLNDVNGIVVDSMGNIYIGESESSCIQVYAPNGIFQYGFYFPTGPGWFAFGLDNGDQIHIVTARTDSHYIFKNGKLVSQEELVNYQMQTTLEDQYSMTYSSTFQQGKKSYHVTSFRQLKITDMENGSVTKLDLYSPLWPLPIFDFWIIAVIGGAMVFFSFADIAIPVGLFPSGCGNRKKRFRVRARDDLIITTNKTVDESSMILRGLTDPKRPGIFASRKGQKAFWGRVENNQFKISPILGYHGFSVLVFIGEISATETETVLKIHVRPHVASIISLTIWMTFCGLISLLCVMEIIVDRFQSMLLIPFIMLAFGYGTFYIPFWREEKKARILLEKAFTSESGLKR